MKKWLCVAALLAALLLALSALAQEDEVNLTLSAPSGMADYPQSLCFVGDVLYALGGSALYRCAPGEGEAQVVLDLSDSSGYAYQAMPPQSAESVALWERAIAHLFADGDTLMALAPMSGRVYTVQDDELRFAFALPESLLAMADDALSKREVLGAACEGGELFLLLGTDDWAEFDKTELFAVDLSTQAVRACAPQGARNLTGAAPGKLLLAKYTDAGETELTLYDIAADGEEGTPIRFAQGDSVGAPAWFDGEPVLLSQGRIVRASAPQTALAYVPASFASLNMAAACSTGGRYAVATGSGLCLRDLTSGRAAEKTELVVGGTLDETLLARFAAENPDIAVVQIENQTALRAAMLSGDSDFDVLLLNAPGGFADYAGRGYLAEIDSEALRAWVGGLYPAIRDAVQRDGALFGVPIGLSPESWTVDTTIWEEAGLGELPQTYADVFAFIRQWMDEKAQDYPDFAPCDWNIVGVPGAVWEAVRGYVLENETPGEPFSFDTPAFREAMSAIIDGARLLEEPSDQWSMQVLSSYNQGFGISYNDDQRMMMMLAPAIGEGERVMTAQLRVLAVSAASEHPQEAARLIEWFASNLSDTTRYQMDPSLMEPIERENYAARVAQLREEMAAYAARLDGAQTAEELAELEEEIARRERMLEGNEQTRYALSSESIAIYREAARHLRIAWDSLLAVDGAERALQDVIDHFCADGLQAGELDAMILQLDRVCGMIAGEKG